MLKVNKDKIEEPEEQGCEYCNDTKILLMKKKKLNDKAENRYGV